MAVPFIFRLSIYSYFLSSLLIPYEIAHITATFLSFLIIPPATDPITHTFKCLILLVGFVVLYTLLGGKAIYTQFIQPVFLATSKPQKTTKDELKPKPSTMLPPKKATSPVIQELCTKIDSSPVSSFNEKDESVARENHATIITPNMQPAAVIDLSAKTKENPTREPNTATPIIPSNSDVYEINTIDPSPTTSTDELISMIPPVPAKILITENDDQLTKETHVAIDNTINKVAQQATEQLIPSPEPEDSVATLGSSTVDHDVASGTDSTLPEHDNASDSSKEHYYAEIIKKTNNLSHLSENLQRIFDAPLTPSPDNNNRPVSSSIAIQPSTSSSIDQLTPALTPPNPSSAAGSTLSRKSSIASHHSFSQFKSRFQMVAQQRPGPKQQSEKQLEKQPMQTQQQQISSNDSAIDASSVGATKKKRFSTLLGRKKSINKSEEPVVIIAGNNEQQPELPPVTLKPKKSVSSKLQKGLKKTGKRFSSIFSK